MYTNRYFEVMKKVYTRKLKEKEIVVKVKNEYVHSKWADFKVK